MKLLTLNCQKGYRPELRAFFKTILEEGFFDVILLQEANEKVVDMLPLDAQYTLIQPINPALDGPTQVGMLHKKSLSFAKSWFFPVTQFSPEKTRPEFGLVTARLKDAAGTSLLIGSAHLHSSFHFILRKRELTFFKEQIQRIAQPGDLIILGGDFNSGLPWECRRNANLMAPEFYDLVPSKTTTCDSRFVEPTVRLNRFSLRLAKLGIGVVLSVDHVFTNLPRSITTECLVLPDRVSDHSPVSITFLSDYAGSRG